MKLTSTTCIALAVAVAKVSADCFSTSMGYPCCSSNNTKVEYVDTDGEWGIENGNWCGIPPKVTCTGQNQGYQCCNSCNVEYTDGDGPWGVENGQWCGIKSSCNGQQQPQQPQKTTQPSNPQPTSINVSGVPLNPPPVTGGQTGKTTRYWDCCTASCSWSENTKASHPVNVCKKDGVTRISNFTWQNGNICDNKDPNNAGYMCNDNQPWAINENVSYGFVAAGFSSGQQKDWCCTCQRLEFTSGPVKGKQMVVQITNTGGDLSNNHFDIQMPGGGVGIFNGCAAQWGASGDGWGERYGGLKSNQCSSLPKELQEGCNWRFDWFKNADNPTVTFERVQCPKELTDITGCIPVDDASAKKLPW